MIEADHDLMRRCRQGDEAAFATLLRRWQPSVARVLRRLVPPNGTAGGPAVEDLCQEVFLRVLSARNRYRDDFAFSTWIYRIALNVARDAARRRQAGRKKPGFFRKTGLLDAQREAEKTAGDREIQEQVAEALAELPARWREPLILRHYGDMTFDEAARVLKLPPSTVKSRVRKGLLELRARLKARGIDEKDIRE